MGKVYEQVEKMVDLVCDCDGTMPIRDAASMFMEFLTGTMQDSRTIFAKIEKEMGKDTIRSLAFTFIMGYLGTLYASTHCENQEEAMEFMKQFDFDHCIVSKTGEEISISSEPKAEAQKEKI